MFEGIPVTALGPLGTLALVLAAPFLQMARGKLIPVSFLEAAEARHREAMQAAEERHKQQLELSETRAREWREAHIISETARATSQEQTHELLEHAKTSAAILNVMSQKAAGS
jgi:hypothetical protein